MEITKAANDQFPAVRAFYHSLIDGYEDAPYGAGWKKDIYPAPEFLAESIRNGELYIAVEEGAILGAMVLNHLCNDSYGSFAWPVKLAPEDVTVIHALGVHPAYAGRGYGKQMVLFAIEKARAEKQKAVRLDVLMGNLPAEKLYKGAGFRYLHTLPMFYEDTGWTDYELYEYLL